MRRHMTLAGLERLSLIKSVQTASITIADGASSGTATIAPVYVKSALLLYNGYRTSSTSGQFAGDYEANVTLTNETTVTATRGVATASYNVTVQVTLVQFAPEYVKSIQYISFAFVGSGGGAGTRSVTIAAVNRSKAFISFLGVNSNASGGTFHNYQSRQVCYFESDTVVRWLENTDAFGSGGSWVHKEAVVELW